MTPRPSPDASQIAAWLAGRFTNLRGTQLEQRLGHHHVQQPDRLEVRREEGTRGAEHVVGVGIREVPVRQGGQNRASQPGVAAGRPEAGQDGGVDGALREPELVTHHPPAIVILALVPGVAGRAAMAPRTPWIELEEQAVALAPPAPAREARLLRRHPRGFVRQEPVEIGSDRIGQRGQSAGRDGHPGIQRGTRQQHQEPEAGRSHHSRTVAISPRRSMRTASSRRVIPCTPRAW